MIQKNEKLVCQINGVVGDYGVKEGKSKASMYLVGVSQ
jgi:hypothetical protein